MPINLPQPRYREQMATPRSKLVSDEVPLYYHVTSRCVQQAWLLGPDPTSGKNYSHRKRWLIRRLKHLGRFFALEVSAYAVMNNHFHLVIYFDPTAAGAWPAEEVARRWVEAFPPKVNGKIDKGMQRFNFEELMSNPEELEKARKKLGSLSCFMKHLKQNIAYRANRETETTGDFWANRFYSGALLDEDAVLESINSWCKGRSFRPLEIPLA